MSGNTATTQKYSLSVSSGTEKTKLFASTSYNREEGLLNNENLNRYSLRLNLDQQIFSWAKVGFTSNLVYRDLNSGVKNTFTKSLSAIPLGDASTEKGEINHEYITGQYSPMSDFIENQYVDNTRSTYLNVSGYVELTSFKDLTFTSRVNCVALKRECLTMNDIEKCIFLEGGINLDNNINIGGINLFKSTGA